MGTLGREYGSRQRRGPQEGALGAPRAGGNGSVLIVGGGIGGMAAAAALGQAGVNVQVVEIRPELLLAAAGVGLGQSANALRMLEALGVLAQCMERGYVFDRIKLFDDRGAVLTEHVFQLGDERIPPFCSLPRDHLHKQLTTAALATGASVTVNETVESLSQDPDGVDVVFRSGRTGRYDAVVGFDGVRSRIRQLMFGDAFEPAYTGYGAWRVTATRPATVSSMENYSSIGSKVAILPIDNDRMYLSRIGPEPIGVFYEQDDFPALLKQRMSAYGGIPGDVASVVHAESTIVYAPLEAVPIPPRWSLGRIVLAGDAAHACPPHLTQGAAMALEDAVVLSRELCRDRGVALSLQEFSRLRRPRCEFVQRVSTEILESEQSIPSPQRSSKDKEFLAQEFARRLRECDIELDRDVLELST